MSPSLVRSAALAGAVLLCACNTGPGVPPSVVSTTPADGATGVARDVRLEATFDGPLDPASVSPESFVVEGVSGAVGYDAGRKTATFTPSAPLAPGAQITARLTTGVRSERGLALKQERRWSFTVAVAPLNVASVVPLEDATGVGRASPVSATFSTDLDETSLTASAFTLTAEGATGPLAASLSYDAATRTATLTPAAPLSPGARYTAEVKELRSNAGAPLSATKRWSFTASADVTAPSVVSSSPADGALAVSQRATISVSFDEPIDPATAAGAISVSGSVTGTTSYDAATRTLRFTPTNQLPGNSTLTVTVGTQVTDVAGNPLAAPFTFSFTTEADTTRPQIVSTSPAANATVEPVAGVLTITVTFSEPMLESTFNNVFLNDPNNQGMSRTTAWNAAIRTLTITCYPRLVGTYTLAIYDFYKVTDLAGNALASYTLRFSVKDTTPPEVRSIFPSAANRFVSPTSGGNVTFNEAIDPATLASSFTVDGVPVTASMPWPSFMPGYVEFSLGGPLTRGATHTLVISTALKDKAGNALAAPVTIPFYVLPEGEVVSGATRPFVGTPGQLAFSSNGDGLAAWRSEQGEVFYARYSGATKSWGPGVALGVSIDADYYLTLAAGSGGRFLLTAGFYGSTWVVVPGGISGPFSANNFNPSRDPFVDTGDSFLFATSWQQSLTLQRLTASGFGPVFTATASANATQLTVASTGSGRTVLAYLAGEKQVIAREISGETVGAETVLASLPADTSTSFPRFNLLRLAADGTGLSALWESNTSKTTGAATDSVSTSTAATVWSAPVAVLSTATGNASLALVASGGDLMAAADPNTTSGMVTARRSAGSWGAQQTLSDAGSYTLLAVPAGFAARGDTTGSTWLAEHGAGGWASPTTIVPYSYPAAATCVTGSGYGLVFLDNNILSESHAIPGGYSAKAEIGPLSTSLSDFVAASGGSSCHALYATGGRLWAREVGGSNGTVELTTPGTGRVRSVQLVAAPDGTLLAAWTQRDLDFTHLYVRTRVGGTWGAVLTVDSDVGDNAFRAASDGTRFVIAWQRQLQLSTRTWSAGTLGAKVVATTLPSGTGVVPISIAANSARFALLWGGTSGAQAALSADGASWSTPAAIGPTALATSLRIAGRGTGFAAVTSDPTGISATLFDGTAWQAATQLTPDRMRESWDLAAADAGYAIAWGYGTTGYGGRVATWTPTGATWSTTSYLVSADASANNYLAARGAGFAALVGGSNWYRLDYANGAWGETRNAGIYPGPHGSLLADTAGVLVTSDYGLSYLPDGARGASDDLFKGGSIAAWGTRFGVVAAMNDGLHFAEF